GVECRMRQHRVVEFAGELAHVALVQRVLNFERQSKDLGDNLGGVARPRERTRNHQVWREELRDPATGFERLPPSGVGQRQGRRRGRKAALAVPLALAVTNHYQPAGSLPGHPGKLSVFILLGRPARSSSRIRNALKTEGPSLSTRSFEKP